MRNPPHIWKRFWSLKIGETFSIGKKGYVKLNFLQARRITLIKLPGLFVSPMLRVRTTTPIKKTHITDKQDAAQMAIAANKYWPRAKDCLRGPQETAQTGAPMGTYINGEYVATVGEGKTHYVGDSCPGGHAGELGEPGHPDNPFFCRDPLVQDHTPDQVPTHEQQRTL